MNFMHSQTQNTQSDDRSYGETAGRCAQGKSNHVTNQSHEAVDTDRHELAHQVPNKPQGQGQNLHVKTR